MLPTITRNIGCKSSSDQGWTHHKAWCGSCHCNTPIFYYN